jgi:phosphoglycolate phosphatase
VRQIAQAIFLLEIIAGTTEPYPSCHRLAAIRICLHADTVYNLRMITLLFDIDGTLIHTGGAGGAALRSAFQQLFPVTELREVEYCGRTDRAICHDFLTFHNVEISDLNWSKLRAAYLDQLPTHLSSCRGRVLPGIVDLLERLAAKDDLAVGLLTGNLRDGARLKLEYYRLMHHFRFGGFGDDHLDRNDVAECALEAARQHANGSFDPNRVWVIGDTPLDIRCARWIKAKVLAVATGNFTRDQLASFHPDLCVEDLSDTRQLASLLL